jgi:hypothetical protein
MLSVKNCDNYSKKMFDMIYKPVAFVAPAFPAKFSSTDTSRFAVEVFVGVLATTQRRKCTPKRAETPRQLLQAE